MNKLLSISVVLLSLNLYGADKTPREIALEKENKELKELVAELAKDIEIHKFMAEKLKLKEELSGTGLEGWGKKDGVKIIVEDYSESDKTFDAKAIKNQVELRLRLAGIKVANKGISPDFLIINANPIEVGGRIVGYGFSLSANRYVKFEANGKNYRDHSQTWGKSGIAPAKELRVDIDAYMDALLLDYLKANPKKEEK